MSRFTKDDTVFVIAKRMRPVNGQRVETKQAVEGNILSAGPKWVRVEYRVNGVRMIDTFDATTGCLKNFGDVKKIVGVEDISTELLGA